MTPSKNPTATARYPWRAFRDNARDHLRDAENKLVLLDPMANAKGVAADAVLAAIAFGDAITLQRPNQHAGSASGRSRCLQSENSPP